LSTQLTKTPMRDHMVGEHNGLPLCVITTLDPDKDEDKVVLAAATMAHVSILDSAEKPIAITQYVEWDEVITDEQTGEEKVVHRCGFIDVDGACHSSTGSDIPRKMKPFIMLFGPPPWIPPRWFKFGAGVSKDRRTFHWIRPCNPPPGMAQ
jgi:hypothetical protein